MQPTEGKKKLRPANKAVLIKAKETTHETNLILSQMVRGNYIGMSSMGKMCSLRNIKN